MKYKLKVYSIWEYGQRKDSEGNPHQEDCTFPLPKDLKDSDRTFILCDGMGGHDAGEVASATVCTAMGNFILNDSHDAEGLFTDDDLKEAIAAAFSALDLKDSGAEKKMGTTMTLLKLHDNGATIAHMGDSRVYHIRPGDSGEDTQILFETEDHSLVNDLIKIGELTKEEARMSKQKNVITRAMQPNMERMPKADIKHITDIKPGDFFYLCSDGMLEQEDMSNGESLKNIFSHAVESVEDKVRILTEATKHNKDNHTALIIHIEDVEGGYRKCEEEKSVIPAYDMALVEEDSEITSRNNNTDVLSEKITSLEKTWRQNSRTELYKMILRCIIVAIIVVICTVFIRNFSSCSREKTPDEIEFNKKEKTAPSRNGNGRKKTKPHAQAQVGDQLDSPQSVAVEVVNYDATQQNPNTPQSSNFEDCGTATMTINLSSSGDVVNSDNQLVQELIIDSLIPH